MGGGVKLQYCIRLLSLGYQNIQGEKAGHSDHSPTKLNQVKYPGFVYIYVAYSLSLFLDVDTTRLLQESLQALSDDIWC